MQTEPKRVLRKENSQPVIEENHNSEDIDSELIEDDSLIDYDEQQEVVESVHEVELDLENEPKENSQPPSFIEENPDIPNSARNLEPQEKQLSPRYPEMEENKGAVTTRQKETPRGNFKIPKHEKNAKLV